MTNADIMRAPVLSLCARNYLTGVFAQFLPQELVQLAKSVDKEMCTGALGIFTVRERKY